MKHPESLRQIAESLDLDGRDRLQQAAARIEELETALAAAPPLPEPMSVSEREQAAEAIGLLAEWVHRVASGLAGARVLGSDQLGYALSAMNAATATVARMGECQPGDDGAVVFARLKERSMRKAQILAGQGIPNFGKRGRG